MYCTHYNMHIHKNWKQSEYYVIILPAPVDNLARVGLVFLHSSVIHQSAQRIRHREDMEYDV